MKSFIINFVLFLISRILFYPLSLMNITYILLFKNGNIFKKISNYFYSSAYDIDIYGNREFRSLWNAVFIKQDILDKSHLFGSYGETISYVLGKNKEYGTLSYLGKIMCIILNFCDKDHVEKTVIEYEKNLKK